MRKTKRWSHEEILKIVLKHVNEGQSFTSLEREFNCSTKLIRRWVSKYCNCLTKVNRNCLIELNTFRHEKLHFR